MTQKHASGQKPPEKDLSDDMEKPLEKPLHESPAKEAPQKNTRKASEVTEPEVAEPEVLGPVENEDEEVEPEPTPDPAEELKSQLLRLRADFENFRKRTRREKEEWTTRSLEHVCGDLLTVLDHFELGLKNAEDLKVAPEVIKGFALVNEQLKAVLGKYGLSPVNAEEAFDPNLHEAISYVASPEVPADHVLAMTRRGYKLGERLLRPAQVVVSQGPPEPVATEEPTENEVDAASEESGEGKTEES
ncbi:MAG: nucleotide exchange factor GrpE [Verrucomicrobia bacterium]|nr:nucleotide exchange factor GrpE [Verrucomicrobiota bacterium]MCH8513688.1 nucleotide exchange factor GrpE [Kiritimatiellia bacterium]